MKKAVGVIIAIFLILIVGGTSYFFVVPMIKEASSGGAEDVVYVTNVDKIINGFSFASNRYSGVVETQELVKIDADVDKKIKTTFVKAGDTVKTGDKLFEYDVDEMKIELEQTKLDIAQAESEIKGYKQQISELEKEKNNTGNNTANKQLTLTNKINELKLYLTKAEYSKESYNKSITKLERSIKNNVVKSSVDGTVQSVNDPSSNSYVTIASNGDLRVKAVVNEENVMDFYEDEAITIRSRINEDLVWSGKVVSIDTAKPMSNTASDEFGSETITKYPIYISIDNTDGLMIGQHVTVEERVDEEAAAEQDKSIWLFDFYINDIDSDPYVWAEGPDKTIEKRSVKIGEFDDTMFRYEIKSGLSKDDYIAFPEPRITEGMSTTYNAEDVAGGDLMDGADMMGDDMMIADDMMG